MKEKLLNKSFDWIHGTKTDCCRKLKVNNEIGAKFNSVVGWFDFKSVLAHWIEINQQQQQLNLN